MIGVIAKKSEQEAVKEFFQLFKTPWEFYQINRSYDVVISTDYHIPRIGAKLLIIYASNKIEFDMENESPIPSQKKGTILDYNGKDLPIYGEILTSGAKANSVIIIKGTNESVGVVINGKSQKIIRVGFNLFYEIYFLLSSGQPSDYSCIPTLELHILMLRDMILSAGIPLIEIPPVPAGYDFITCLTHDVDFFGIKKNKFDHTILGFVYRALFGSLINVFRGKTSWNKLLKNWTAALLLPAVYLKIVQDFWIQFDHYIEIEKDLNPTFFIIPFKNRAGKNIPGQKSNRRATQYDINDIKSEVQWLISNGCEIGLHGIDAWWDAKKGYEEFKQISAITGNSDIGVRMHWLFFNNESPQILEKAGFLYDSTLGYNDAVGYRSGTTQVFRPVNAKKLLEVPLNFQDTALFYPKRMDLTESRAFDLAKLLLNNAKTYGGVLTINWHHRSIAPERLWGDFYLKILEEIKRHKVWFAGIREVVKWFSLRRAITFKETEIIQNSMKLRLKGHLPSQEPGLLLRFHKPNQIESTSQFLQNYKSSYHDLLLQNSMEVQFSF